MSLPAPHPGLVIRYSYLWHRKFLAGREEGVKDRPCAIVLTAKTSDGNSEVVVLPITHRIPEDPSHAVEIPQATKRRLGLDPRQSGEFFRDIWEEC